MGVAHRMCSIHADWGETVPLQEQRHVSQSKTRPDAQRKTGRGARVPTRFRQIVPGSGLQPELLRDRRNFDPTPLNSSPEFSTTGPKPAATPPKQTVPPDLPAVLQE
jgi:hypothetical protein